MFVLPRLKVSLTCKLSIMLEIFNPRLLFACINDIHGHAQMFEIFVCDSILYETEREREKSCSSTSGYVRHGGFSSGSYR